MSVSFGSTSKHDVRWFATLINDPSLYEGQMWDAVGFLLQVPADRNNFRNVAMEEYAHVMIVLDTKLYP